LKSDGELGEDLAQQKPEPTDQATEVVADGGQDGIGGISLAVPEIIAVHSMVCFEVADHRLDGGAPSQLARLIFGVIRRFWPDVNTLNL